MQIELTQKSVNAMAVQLVSQIPTLPKPAALEFLAKGFGFRNFDTLSGILKRENRTDNVTHNTAPQKPFPHFELNEPVKIWMSCFSVKEGGEFPAWIGYDLDEAVLHEILKMQATCKAEGYIYINESDDVATFDNTYFAGSVIEWGITVTKETFYLVGETRHGDIFKSCSLDIAELLSVLKGVYPATKHMLKLGNELFHDFTNAQDLFAAIERSRFGFSSYAELATLFGNIHGKTLALSSSSEQTQFVTQARVVLNQKEDIEDEIAEWVGLHYHKNYGAMPYLEQFEWAIRFVEAHAS